MSDAQSALRPQPEVPPRRTFLRQAGALTAASLLLAACGDDDPEPQPTATTFELPTGDAGLVSYLFLLERFSADFYQRLLASPAPDLSAADLAVLRDVYRHELMHRDLLASVMKENALVSDIGVSSLVALEFNYGAFTLTTRQGVLAAARTIEDLGTAALCGAVRLFSSAVYVQLAVRLTAVESRHSAAVRDLLQPGSFAAAEVVANTGADAGFNLALAPAAVLTELSKYTAVPVTGNGLPTT
ncbi:ferritin-like domain-containing protein [Hymenobacter latericus]|uniref:ferritin-like domain-containing protein n=1 Tax=Hymenobacter sp. YIM 151858-1 TaxID=2987688 RepID=UPI002227F7DE|nr:ferritin-like domain-containing protein [Hymenobacter sp. YIM 151858-1]UYZ59031.1 ferritin-like domain-containing protein [Hymenobacter sp. YIM 151858-1]